MEELFRELPSLSVLRKQNTTEYIDLFRSHLVFLRDLCSFACWIQAQPHSENCEQKETMSSNTLSFQFYWDTKPASRNNCKLVAITITFIIVISPNSSGQNSKGKGRSMGFFIKDTISYTKFTHRFLHTTSAFPQHTARLMLWSISWTIIR